MNFQEKITPVLRQLRVGGLMGEKDLSFDNPTWEESDYRVCYAFPGDFFTKSTSSTLVMLNQITRQVERNTGLKIYVDFCFQPSMPEVKVLRQNKIPDIFGWNSFNSLEDFDLIGPSYSVHYEVVNFYQIVLGAGLPEFFSQRVGRPELPFIFGGGNVATAIEPSSGHELGPVVDCMFIGEAEDRYEQVLEWIIRNQELMHTDRMAFIQKFVNSFNNIYFPAGYEHIWWQSPKHGQWCIKEVNKKYDWCPDHVKIHRSYSTRPPMFEDTLMIIANDSAARGELSISKACSGGACYFCFDESTLLATDQGFLSLKELGELNKPFQVSTINGTREVSNFHHNGKKESLKITFDSGLSLVVSEDHKMMATDGSEVSASSLVVGDCLLGKTGGDLWGSDLSIVSDIDWTNLRVGKDIHLPDKMTPDLAYLIGYFLADGSYGRSTEVKWYFHKSSPSLSRIKNLLKSLFLIEDNRIIETFSSGTVRIGITSKQFGQYWGQLVGFPKENRVPLAIRKADREVFLAFFGGLVAADGTLDKKGGFLQLSQSRPELIADVQQMLMNAGVYARVDQQVHTLKSEHSRFVGYKGKVHFSSRITISRSDSTRLGGLLDFLDGDKKLRFGDSLSKSPKFIGTKGRPSSRFFEDGIYHSEIVDIVSLGQREVKNVTVPPDYHLLVAGAISTYQCKEGAEGATWREFAPDAIIENMEVLKRAHAPNVLSFFSYNSNYYSQINDLYKATADKFSYISAIAMRSDVLGAVPDYIRMLKHMGIFRVTVALEGISDHIRNNVLNKCLSWDHYLQAIEQVFSQRFVMLKSNLIFCLAKGTRILVKRDGLNIHEAIENVRSSDLVLGPKGFSKHRGVRSQGQSKVVKLRLTNGMSFVQTDDHPVATYKNGELVHTETGRLKPGDYVLGKKGRPGEYYPSGFDPKSWFLGYFFGDGSHHPYIDEGSAVYVAKHQEELIPQIEDFLATNSFLKKKTFVKQGVWRFDLNKRAHHFIERELGLREGKSSSFTDEMWKLPEGSMNSFIRGLFDSDGSVTNGGVVFRQNREQFVEDLQKVLFSQGITSSIYPNSKGQGIGFQLRISTRESLRTYAKFIGFSLKSKIEKLALLLEKESTREKGSVIPSYVFEDLRTSGDSNFVGSTNLFGRNNQNHSQLAVKRELQHWEESTGKSQMKEILDNGWEFLLVESVEQFGEEEVFDLQETETGWFVSGGLVVHNTGYETPEDIDEFIFYVEKIIKMRERMGAKTSLVYSCTTLVTYEDVGLQFSPRRSSYSEHFRLRIFKDLVRRGRALGVRFRFNCIAEGSRILTDQGFKKIESIQDEKVLGPNGYVSHQGSVLQGEDEVFKIILKNGMEKRYTEGHPVSVVRDGEVVKREVSELKPGDWLMMKRAGFDRTEEYRQNDEAYFLGLMLGDGTIHKGKAHGTFVVGKNEPELRRFAETFLRSKDAWTSTSDTTEKDGTWKVYFNAEYAREIQSKLGYVDERKPDGLSEYVWSLSPQSLRSFVRGFWDTDGSISKTGDLKITQTKKQTILDIQSVMFAMGVMTNLSKLCSAAYKDGMDYRLRVIGRDSWINFNQMIGFGVSSKNSRLKEWVISKANGVDGADGDVIPHQIFNRARKMGWLNTSRDGTQLGKELSKGHKGNVTRYRAAKDFDLIIDEEFRSHIQHLLSGEFAFVQIESINPDGMAQVYDVLNTEEGWFVQDGLVVHNSGPGFVFQQLLVDCGRKMTNAILPLYKEAWEKNENINSGGYWKRLNQAVFEEFDMQEREQLEAFFLRHREEDEIFNCHTYEVANEPTRKGWWKRGAKKPMYYCLRTASNPDPKCWSCGGCPDDDYTQTVITGRNIESEANLDDILTAIFNNKPKSTLRVLYEFADDVISESRQKLVTNHFMGGRLIRASDTVNEGMLGRDFHSLGNYSEKIICDLDQEDGFGGRGFFDMFLRTPLDDLKQTALQELKETANSMFQTVRILALYPITYDNKFLSEDLHYTWRVESKFSKSDLTERFNSYDDKVKMMEKGTAIPEVVKKPLPRSSFPFFVVQKGRGSAAFFTVNYRINPFYALSSFFKFSVKEAIAFFHVQRVSINKQIEVPCVVKDCRNLGSFSVDQNKISSICRFCTTKVLALKYAEQPKEIVLQNPVPISSFLHQPVLPYKQTAGIV